MKNTTLKCLGEECNYYLKQYVVIKHGGGWVPNFALPIDKYCTHPSIRPLDRSMETTQGRNINNISVCPLTENENA